jgi:hypothetical protein
MASNKLKEAIRSLRRRRTAVSLSPDSPFDALLQQRLESLERQVEELKGRVNGLVLAVVGAVIVQLILGLLR